MLTVNPTQRSRIPRRCRRSSPRHRPRSPAARARARTSDPVSLHLTRVTPCGPSTNTVTEAGETAIRWNRSRCTPVKCAIDRLDRVRVRHHHDHLAGMVGDDVLERGDHAALHLRDRLALGEAGPRRRALHRLPEVGLREVGELATGPLAVVGLDDAVERADLELVVPGDVLGGLARAVDRARVHRGDRAARRVADPRSRPVRARARRGRCPASGRRACGPVCGVTACRTSTSVVGFGGAGASGASTAASGATEASGAVAVVVSVASRLGAVGAVVTWRMVPGTPGAGSGELGAVPSDA